MNYRFILLIIIVLQSFTGSVLAQSDTIRLGRATGLQLSGFARIDYIYDTRQTSEAVEGLFTFFPTNKLLDANGKDMNAADKANFASIASRLSTRFFAPDIVGAKSSAYIEFDFTGTSNTNGVRFRQGYVNLAWPKSNLLMGRTWHPLASSTIPNVIGLNTGAPFWGFNRSDMVRFDYKPERCLLSLMALYQSDYASLGPTPGTAAVSVKNPVYLRDALWPEFAFQIGYRTQAFQIGAVGTLKSLKPRQYTMVDYSNPDGFKYKTDEKITTYALQGYAQYLAGAFAIKAQATYAQNTTESLMLGGYAVKAIDPLTGHEKYTPTQHLNYWLNVDYGKKWQAGLFAGYIHNLGTLDNVAGAWFARAPEIKYMYRISPHLFYNINNLQFAIEFEYTAAAFGDIQNGQKAKIVNASEVANFRTNLMVCFYF